MNKIKTSKKSANTKTVEEIAKLFSGRCYANGNVMVIQPRFNAKYTFNGEEYEFTEVIADEMIKKELVIERYRDNKYIDLIGNVKLL